MKRKLADTKKTHPSRKRASKGSSEEGGLNTSSEFGLEQVRATQELLQRELPSLDDLSSDEDTGRVDDEDYETSSVGSEESTERYAFTPLRHKDCDNKLGDIFSHRDSIFWACKNGLLESWCVVGNRQLPVPAARELYLMVCTSPDEALVDAVIHEVASLYKNQRMNWVPSVADLDYSLGIFTTSVMSTKNGPMKRVMRRQVCADGTFRGWLNFVTHACEQFPESDGKPFTKELRLWILRVILVMSADKHLACFSRECVRLAMQEAVRAALLPCGVTVDTSSDWLAEVSACLTGVIDELKDSGGFRLVHACKCLCTALVGIRFSLPEESEKGPVIIYLEKARQMCVTVLQVAMSSVLKAFDMEEGCNGDEALEELAIAASLKVRDHLSDQFNQQSLRDKPSCSALLILLMTLDAVVTLLLVSPNRDCKMLTELTEVLGDLIPFLRRYRLGMGGFETITQSMSVIGSMRRKSRIATLLDQERANKS
mmetsp:Transcript_24621/g.36256  ORF Transcript_24621/g.36256 Transcript_24621/m.36256 type:complete len:485 (+) Transcript_24621:68-1522(+)